MNEYTIEFLRPAIEHIEKIAKFHMKMVGTLSAEKITDKLLDHIQTLEDQPLLGTIHPDPVLKRQNFRKLIIGDYICIYKIIRETIYIYGIFHGNTNYPKSFL